MVETHANFSVCMLQRQQPEIFLRDTVEIKSVLMPLRVLHRVDPEE